MKKYEVVKFKKAIIKGEPIGLCVVIYDSRYVAIVEYNYFTAKCTIIHRDYLWFSENPEGLSKSSTYSSQYVEETVLSAVKKAFS